MPASACAGSKRPLSADERPSMISGRNMPEFAEYFASRGGIGGTSASRKSFGQIRGPGGGGPTGDAAALAWLDQWSSPVPSPRLSNFNRLTVAVFLESAVRYLLSSDSPPQQDDTRCCRQPSE
jgi:hypothetical protein